MLLAPQNTYPVHTEHCQWTCAVQRQNSVLQFQCNDVTLETSQTVGTTIAKLGEVLTTSYERYPETPGKQSHE